MLKTRMHLAISYFYLASDFKEKKCGYDFKKGNYI